MASTEAIAPRQGYRVALAVLDSLPGRVKHRRQALGLTMAECGKQIGCSESTIHRLEHGGGITSATAHDAIKWLLRNIP